jgi:hypothetical protein
MEFTVRALATFLIISSAVAEPEPRPSPTPSPIPAALSPAIPESPLPDGLPQQQAPTILLPDPNFLPSPAKLSPGNDSPLGDTPYESKYESKPELQDETRFQKLKSAVMGSARANYLLKEAKTALSNEARKNFMRAYYYTICAQMRRLDPSLKSVIKNYETVEIEKLGSESSSHGIKKKTAHSKNSSGSRLASAKKRHHSSKE